MNEDLYLNDIEAADLEAWMLTEDIDYDDLDDQFRRTDSYGDGLASYVEDFPYSTEYQQSFDRWLHERMDDR